MRVSAHTLAATLGFLASCAIAAGAWAAQGSVRGAVADGSGGVLPGVTVVAALPDGRILATVVTDAVGAYAIPALPAGIVHLTFELEGFSTAAVDATIKADGETRVVQRLQIANRTESVTVLGRAPALPLPPPRIEPPAPPPEPPLVARPVPAHDHASICGPAKPGAAPESLGTIRAVRRGDQRDLYAKGDELLIDGGTLNGLEAGRNLVARRFYPVSGVGDGAATGEHTAGVLQIVTAAENVSTAVVVYACDELRQGDFLAPFNPEPVRTPDPAGAPNYDDAARILFADAGQMLGAPGRMMVIDRGSDYGVRAGQRLTLFRRENRRTRPIVTGDAVVVAVRNDSATIRLGHVIDAISLGDWAAPQRRSAAVPY
jgi:Carboxypeptidase regulatory-like domain